MRLGAILAGGRSRRFGSDKCVAVLQDRPLLDHVIERLAPQVDEVVVVGHDWPGLVRVEDAPAPGLGPLGGLLGALRHAARLGCREVLTAPCDCPDLPLTLARELSPGPAYVAALPVLGLWPVELGALLEDMLAGEESRSVRAWAERTGARAVAWPLPITNLNTQAEWEAFSRRPADPRSLP